MARIAITDIYFEFEQRYRGARDEIKARLGFYHPMLAALHERVSNFTAVDYGCGRGEWLEVLGAAGFVAHGIDSDANMVRSCVDAGLNVTCGDLFAHVERLTASDTALISAFHVVEHLPIDGVLRFAAAAHEALVDGGLLILETPNPENLAVGACSFYNDPTHIRPIPPLLLQFLVQSAGFDATAVVRLNTSVDAMDGAPKVLNLLRRTIAASPDYAVVAIKRATADASAELQAFAEQASQPNPLSLDVAANIDGLLDGMAQRLNDIDARALAHEARLASDSATSAERHATLQAIVTQQEQSTRDLSAALVARIDRLEESAAAFAAANEELRMQRQHAETEIARLQDELTQREAVIAAMTDSRSWRITAPLRKIVDALKSRR